MLCSVLGCKHGIGRLGFNQGWVMSGIYNRGKEGQGNWSECMGGVVIVHEVQDRRGGK